MIEKLPNGAIIVNTARGDLVNDEDMIAALEVRPRLGYAGLDVFAGEPKINEGYYDLPNTFLLPHLGSAAIEARNQMGFEALDNIDGRLRRQGDALQDRLIGLAPGLCSLQPAAPQRPADGVAGAASGRSPYFSCRVSR